MADNTGAPTTFELDSSEQFVYVLSEPMYSQLPQPTPYTY